MRKTCPRSIRCEEAWYALAAVDLSYCESSPLHFYDSDNNHYRNLDSCLN